VKCAYCGRESVPVTKKGYAKPHVTPAGRPCIGLHIPPHVHIDDTASRRRKRSSRRSRRGHAAR
jgi:hypothetical protein